MVSELRIDRAPSTLRAMTWNLWWRFGDWQARAAAIEAVIRDQAPDVVMLQEVWSELQPDGSRTSHASGLAASLGMFAAITDDPFADIAADGGGPSADNGGRVGFHNAILSRWPLTCDSTADSIALPGVDRVSGVPIDRGYRRALWSVAATPWGDWPLISTHFDYRFDQSGLRQRQAVRLLELITERRGDPDSTLPVLVGADCNAVPDSDEIRLLTGRRDSGLSNIVLSDSWEQRGPGAGHTWLADHPYQPHSAWPNRRIDYLFVSWPRPKPVGNPVGVWLAGADPIGPQGVLASDHLAVVADIRTPS
jgi:endonuclease/exonuclease/phosphatase family metal-dependent hydrolase